MDEKCSVRASGAKKELVLEGFQPLEEWSEKGSRSGPDHGLPIDPDPDPDPDQTMDYP